MKKLLLSGAIISGLNACKKEDALKQSIQNPVATVTSNQSSGRVFFDNGGPRHGEDYGCAAPGNGCLNTTTFGIVIQNDIKSVFKAIESKDAIKISEIFTTYKSTLEKYVENSLINSVIEGTLKVESRGDDLNISKYMIFYTGDKNTVYPFIIEK